MAEAIGVAPAPLTLPLLALKASTALHNTVSSIQNNNSLVKDLQHELQALIAILWSLSDTAGSTDIDLGLLDLPLSRCAEACQDFEEKLLTCLSQSKGHRMSFRDWARLRYMGGDIVDFKRLIATYKATISIALADANLRNSRLTVRNLPTYRDFADTTHEDLQRHLKSIDERLELVLAQSMDGLGFNTREVEVTKAEKSSALRCLEICGQLSQHIDDIQLTKVQDEDCQKYSDEDMMLQSITREGLKACIDNINCTTAELEKRINSVVTNPVRRSILTRSVQTDSGYGSTGVPDSQLAEDYSRTIPMSKVEAPQKQVDQYKEVSARSLTIQLVKPSAEDIQSLEGDPKASWELFAETHLSRCLCTNEELRDVCRAAKRLLEEAGFSEGFIIDNLSVMLKHYFLDARRAARSRLEYASVEILRSRISRTKIARDLVYHSSQLPENDDDSELENSRVIHGMARDQLNEWLSRNAAFNEHISEDMDTVHGERDVNEEDTLSEHYDDQDDSMYSQSHIDEIMKPDFVGHMERFMLEGSAFTHLLHRLYCQATRWEYWDLTRVLLSIPNNDIRFCHHTSTAWLQRIQRLVEQSSTKSWKWWPLPTPDMAVWPTDTRIKWTCHCGRHHYRDIPENEARLLKKALGTKISGHDTFHLCRNLRRRKCVASSLFANLRTLAKTCRPRSSLKTSISQAAGEPSSSATRVTDPREALESNTGTASQTTTVPASGFAHVQSIQSMNSGQQSIRSSGVTSANQNIPYNLSMFGRFCALRLLVATEGSRKWTLCIDQVGLEHTTNDKLAMDKIMCGYKSLRGPLRMLFSIHVLDSFAFSKYMKHRSNRVNPQRTGSQLPEDDSDHEYAVSEKIPPDRPPIDRSEFKDYANFCAKPCYWRLWIFHDRNEPSEHHRLVSRLPKKKTWWHLDGPDPSIAWGLECVHEISAFRVLVWHVAFVA